MSWKWETAWTGNSPPSGGPSLLRSGLKPASYRVYGFLIVTDINIHNLSLAPEPNLHSRTTHRQQCTSIIHSTLNILLRDPPIIHPPPPPPNLPPQTPPTERSAPIPMSPPTQRQRPQGPLHKRQQHLIPPRDPRDAVPRVHPLQTCQVALFEAEVGEWWEVGAARDWFDG